MFPALITLVAIVWIALRNLTTFAGSPNCMPAPLHDSLVAVGISPNSEEYTYLRTLNSVSGQ